MSPPGPPQNQGIAMTSIAIKIWAQKNWRFFGFPPELIKVSQLPELPELPQFDSPDPVFLGELVEDHPKLISLSWRRFNMVQLLAVWSGMMDSTIASSQSWHVEWKSKVAWGSSFYEASRNIVSAYCFKVQSHFWKTEKDSSLALVSPTSSREDSQKSLGRRAPSNLEADVQYIKQHIKAAEAVWTWWVGKHGSGLPVPQI